MQAVNKSMLVSVRAKMKQSLAQNNTGEQPTGKEKVRETRQGFIQKTQNKRSEQLQKFVSERGKGSGVSQTA